MKLVSVKNDLSEQALLWRPFHITLGEIHHWPLVLKNIEEKNNTF